MRETECIDLCLLLKRGHAAVSTAVIAAANRPWMNLDMEKHLLCHKPCCLTASSKGWTQTTQARSRLPLGPLWGTSDGRSMAAEGSKAIWHDHEQKRELGAAFTDHQHKHGTKWQKQSTRVIGAHTHCYHLAKQHFSAAIFPYHPYTLMPTCSIHFIGYSCPS